MEDAGKNGNSEKESPPLQIDPKWYARPRFLARLLSANRPSLRDTLRTFFRPIETQDLRVDFYTMYKRELVEYDVDYIKKYDEDLVSSAFIINVHSNLQPDPNEQSAALLRAILLTLNQSAIPGETPAVPPVREARRARSSRWPA
jgi:hypothetical protein